MELKSTVHKRGREGSGHLLCTYYVQFTHVSFLFFKKDICSRLHSQHLIAGAADRRGSASPQSQNESEALRPGSKAGRRGCTASALGRTPLVSTWKQSAQASLSRAVARQSRWATWCLTPFSSPSRVLQSFLQHSHTCTSILSFLVSPLLPSNF